MKTAIEILFEKTNGDADYISVNNCLEAMQAYAHQALDLAAERQVNQFTLEATKDSILKLKEEI